jgi:tRNA A-37 threonylcarbamoyl transferase component Bud32
MHVATRFDLGERIGGGAAADVHRAYDRELDRDVVVRILRPDVAADEEHAERFLREAEAATDIQHSNVVRVLDHGLMDGRPFLVREVVEGSTLDDLLKRRGALPEDEARALAEQIARGVEAAHARGVLHRDLNAGNVFVTPDGIAKVVDFGVPTTPRHPAPEQVAGEQIDERADVFGLGAVLSHMLTGRTPRGRAAAPRQLARVSRQIEDVALRALDRDPARRYASAAAMADALHALAPRPRAAVPPLAVAPVARVAREAPTERIARPAAATAARRRRRAPLALFAVPFLLALLFAAVTFGRPAPANRAVLSATTTPVATATAQLTPEPTSLPPVETTPEPSPEPTPEPTPIPTLAPAPPPPAAPPAENPAPVAAPQSAAAATVRSFYELISQERFDEAAALWSPRMQANYPPSTNIYGRFDRTRQIVIRSLTPLPQTTSAATVAIDILEVLDSGVTRRWVGSWQLVWDGARWLMDAPNLRAG